MAVPLFTSPKPRHCLKLYRTASTGSPIRFERAQAQARHGVRCQPSGLLAHVAGTRGQCRAVATPSSRRTTVLVYALPIKSIRLDFQQPDHLDGDTVTEIAAALTRGEILPPWWSGTTARTTGLQDGFPRIAAAVSVGRAGIEAEVSPGTLADIEYDWQEYLDALRRKLRSDSGN